MGGITPFLANNIANVYDSAALIYGSIYHSLGGIIPYYANIWAIVHPSYYSFISYSYLYSGIIP